MPDSSWPYAEVAVDSPLDRQPESGSFTYGVPSSLQGTLRPGHIVRVPFGRRQTLGVVVALRQRSPVERTRDVTGLVDDAPQLTDELIATARWMSTHYLAPLINCLRTMLPPGALRRTEPRYRRTQVAPQAAALGQDERKVLAAFGRSRELALSTIRKRSRIKSSSDLRGALAKVVAAGLLERRAGGSRTGARRSTKTMVRLAVDGQEMRDSLLMPTRPNAKADVVSFLRRPDVVLPTPEEVIKATACRPRDLRALAAKGVIDLTPADRLIDTKLSPSEAAAVGRTELARAPGQARLLAHVADAGRPVPASEALKACRTQGSVLDRLNDRGLVRTADVDGTVVMVMRGGRAREAELSLRSLTRHAAALDYVAACGGVASWSHVRREASGTKRVLDDLVQCGLVVATEDVVWRDPLAGRQIAHYPKPTLTSDQRRAWETLAPMVRDAGTSDPSADVGQGRRDACVVHGVTGSGKTELYLRAIAEIVEMGKQAIVLVPEIALTPQTVTRFAGRFPDRVGVWHSGLSEGERRDTWQRARDGDIDIVVGSRSAVFAPLPQLGLIVIDEEHGEAYKQGSTPRYHARDAALQRAAVTEATVLLGSATPSVETYWSAQEGRFALVELPRRVVAAPAGGAAWAELPPVAVVDMRSELKAGNTTVFSRALHDALTETLAAGEQAILLLNRRGTATFVSCRSCGHVQKCPSCLVPLVWHGAGAALVCHHCNRREAPPMMCPTCGSAKIRYFGAGTQAVEDEVSSRFPDARVLRWDADTTGAKGSHEAILAQFGGGGADVLVGTQMIAKGLDLPRVTLVGVVSADTALYLPDIWARERTFQLLAQAAGRAGRSTRGGRVILQTYKPEELAVARAAEHDYQGFFEGEIRFRREHGYPPFLRLACLERVAPSGTSAAQSDAGKVARRLRAKIDRLGLPDADVIGPAPAFFHQLRGRERWHVIVRAADPAALLADEPLGPGWRVDIDPVSVL